MEYYLNDMNYLDGHDTGWQRNVTNDDTSRMKHTTMCYFIQALYDIKVIKLRSFAI